MILRLVFGADAMLGPGKAELLDGIRETGSISAAGRKMGMSYKRAWSLVEEMNAAFLQPLVDRSRGGPGGGGAQLTLTGVAVLDLYRAIETRAAGAVSQQVTELSAMVRDMSAQK